MIQPKPARIPEAIATGLLATKPIAHLLVYALDRQLSGTFELVSETRARMHIVVDAGMVSRVSTSEPVIYLGHILYESGVIDDEQLNTTLASVASTKRLHGQILLSTGMLDAEQLAEALRQQRIRKLHHAFTLSPRTTFAFYSNVDLVGERPDDVEPMDPLAEIWRGVRAHPSWDHVRTTLTAVRGRRLRIVGDIDRLKLEDKERTAAVCLRQTPATVAEFASRAGLDARAADLLTYFLVITKLVEVAAHEAVIATAPPPPSLRDTLGVTLSSGEYIRKISFAMRAASPDAQSLRIPSPMPGMLTAAARAGSASKIPRPSAPPTSQVPAPVDHRKEQIEAEQFLSQAEMHLVLAEREQAIGFTRKALAVVPEMPEATALLAYLEALGLAEGQVDYLRDLVKIIDGALAKDETCRRGRFYRAELKKRMGDHEGAIRDLRVAVANDPDDADAQRELRAYEQWVRDGTVTIRSMSPFGGTKKPTRLFDRLRGK